MDINVEGTSSISQKKQTLSASGWSGPKIVTIDPSGDGDYLTLPAAITGELSANANLVTLGRRLTFLIQGTWSSADTSTTIVSLNGFTTSADYFITITTDSANRAGTSWSTSKYRFESSYGGAVLDLVPNYTILDGVQVRATHAGSGTAVLMTGAYCKVLNSYIRSSFRGLTHTGGNGVVVNSIIIGAARGIYQRNGAILSVYYSNAICTGAGYGIQAWTGGRVLTCKNSYFHGGTGSIYDEGGATITMTNCATSDGLYSTTDVDYTTSNFANVTAGSEDFDPPAGSGVLEIGTDLSEDVVYPVTTDILNTTRSLLNPCVGVVEKHFSVEGTINSSQKKQTTSISGTSEFVLAVNGSIAAAQKKQSTSISGTSVKTATIIDHTHVDLYESIPQDYIDIIITKWFNIPGESHSYNYRRGLQFVEDLDSKFAVSVVESGTPEGSTTEHLRASRATWGNIDSATGWVYGYGEEDYFTSALAITRTKAHLQYCHDNSLEIGYMGFGWCWDMLRNIAGSADPVYMCRWAGSSVGGPEGDRIWGLDAEDTSITSNSVCMDTYLNATKEYIDYCAANGISAKIFYTTGPVDSYTGEAAYQREVKHDYIRNYITTNGGYLFDYADILCWNNAGVRTTANWTDGESTVHTFSQIAADNLLNFDGSDGSGSPYHIGERGELRVGKAVWVMLAMMEGWDGTTGESIVETSSVIDSNSNILIALSSITETNAIVDSQNSYIQTVSSILETETITEAQNSIIIGLTNIVETVTVISVETSSSIIPVSTIESSSIIDTSSNINIASVSSTESNTITDSQENTYITTASRTESTNIYDIEDVNGSNVAIIIENSIITEDTNSSVTTQVSTLEQIAITSDDINSFAIISSTLEETSSIQDEISVYEEVITVSVSENSSSLDLNYSIIQTSVEVFENTLLSDNNTAYSYINSTLEESCTATDSTNGALITNSNVSDISIITDADTASVMILSSIAETSLSQDEINAVQNMQINVNDYIEVIDNINATILHSITVEENSITNDNYQSVILNVLNILFWNNIHLDFNNFPSSTDLKLNVRGKIVGIPIIAATDDRNGAIRIIIDSEVRALQQIII